MILLCMLKVKMILQLVNIDKHFCIEHINGDNIIGGIDYKSGPFNVTFTVGETSMEFDVPINDDMILENDENFTLVIDMAGLPKDVTVGDHATAVVTIVNDDSKCVYCTCYCMVGSA